MSKFYVSCGSHSLVLVTDTAEQAALALIDSVLASHIWVYDDPGLDEADRRAHIVLEALLHLSSEVQVSERGLGRTDAGVWGVADLIDTWHRLMVSVGKMLVAAGLNGNRCLPSSDQAATLPRSPK